ALLLVRVWHRDADGARPGAAATLAQLLPAEFAAFTLLFLMLFIATNKVFSPQYLLWLLPLAALVPFDGRRRRVFLTGLLLVCILSSLLMPILFLTDLLEPALPGAPLVFRPPTARFTLVLLLRNLLFLCLTAALAYRLARPGPQGPRDPKGTEDGEQ